MSLDSPQAIGPPLPSLSRRKEDELSAFSNDYPTARARFRERAEMLGFQLEQHPLVKDLRGPKGEDLTVDVARLGPEQARRLLIISSGLHGVEGFVGSAVQLAGMEESAGWLELPEGVGLLLIHGLNPFGFAWSRRFDESNIDPNRNFLRAEQSYRGCPPLYHTLNSLLNPKDPPESWDLFPIRALLFQLAYGRDELKQAVAGGQYDYPKGLFFGGHGPGSTYRLLDEQLSRWVGPAERVLHLDIHTGLGRWKTYKLLSEERAGSPRVAWLLECFGAELVEPHSSKSTSYHARGSLGTWCRHKFDDRPYDLLCAEFGTYPGLAVVAALRAENQAYHWGSPEAPSTIWAKRRLREVFAPEDPEWRRWAVVEGLRVGRRALHLLAESDA